MKLKYFTDTEDFRGNMDKMDPKILSMLDELREEYGQAIIINSSYRSPNHPIESVKTNPGEHTYGAAVDVKCIGGENTFDLVNAAIKVGFKRIGININKGFLHLGIGYPNAPEKTIWTY